ncbi:MAG: radical SAM protein [Candidatus Omnitrophota bacterium]
MEEKKIEYAPHGRKLNPCELEIDLFCKGIRIHESCEMDSDKTFSKARAGLGSGLELMVPGPHKNIWLNAPVLEYFAVSSPYELRRVNGAYRVVHTVDQVSYDVVIPTAPSWYSRKTSSGVNMREIGVIQGTYLGIYLGDVCHFWQTDPKENCKFCATGINVGKPGADKAMKTVEEVTEVAQTAKAESGVSFVHFNTGYQKGRGLEVCAPFVKAIKEKVGALAGVQAIPSKDLWKYDWVIDCGADHFSFCYELHNPEYFAKYLPGKERLIGQKTFFNALEYTARKLGKGRVSGEIIAGIEPIEDTLKAIDYITGVGAFPTICIFRPVQGTAMERWPSPSYEDMIVVFRHMYEACMKNNIPVGLVPNIEVSLVVQPNDAEYLIQPSLRYHFYKAMLALMRYPAGILFRKQLKPHQTPGDAFNLPVPKECCCQAH